MAKLFIAALGVLLLSACNPSTEPAIIEKPQHDPQGGTFHKARYKGHDYIIFIYGAKPAIVHDPDCCEI